MSSSSCPVLPVGVTSLLLHRMQSPDDGEHAIARVISSFVYYPPTWRTLRTLLRLMGDDEELLALQTINWMLSNPKAIERYRQPRGSWDLQVMDLAVTRGWLSVVQLLYANRINDDHFDMYTRHCNASRLGHLHVVQYIQDTIEEENQWSLVDAARSGSVAVLDCVFESNQEAHRTKRQRCDAASIPRQLQEARQSMVEAAGKGRIDVVRWLHEHFPELPKLEPDMFAELVHEPLTMEVFQYLHSNGYQGSLDSAFESAAGSGNLELLEYLYPHVQPESFHSAYFKAASGGHLVVIQFLLDHGCPGCDTSTMNAAAFSGHLELVRYLHNHRTEGCTTRAMDDAAENGHLQVVKFLHENRTEGCTKEAMKGAVRNGHAHVVEYLHKTCGSPVDSTMVSTAIFRDHPDVVKYLMGDVGLSIPEREFRQSLKPKSQAMLRYLISRHAIDRSPAMFAGYISCRVSELGSRPSTEMLDYIYDACVAHSGSQRLLTLAEALAADPSISRIGYIHSKLEVGETVDVSPAISIAARRGDLAAVQYLVDIGQTACTYPDALAKAVKSKHVHIVKYLIENDLGGCVPAATETDDPTITEYLRDRLAQHPCKCSGCLPGP